MRLPIRVMTLTVAIILLVVLGRSYANDLSRSPSTHSQQFHPPSKAAPGAASTSAGPTTKAKPPKKFQQQIANVADVPLEYENAMAEFQAAIASLAMARPEVGQLEKFDRNVRFDEEILTNGELPPTSGVLAWYLQISESDKSSIKKSHAEAVAGIPLSLRDGSFTRRGIVIPGSGKEFPVVVAAVKWIRGMNKEIPIEVVLNSKGDFEASYCNDAFPSMNTKCVILEEVFGPEIYGLVYSTGDPPLKYLSALASSFEDVYFMMPESLPLEDPELIFHSGPYKQHGMVLFRDLKDSYISPHFYDVAGVKLGGRARGRPVGPVDIVRQSDRVNAVPGYSTDSSVFILNKRVHFRSLLLALYYNLNGVIYYPLLMQGAEGEEDRDTLAAAATVLGELFYKTERKPLALGYYEDQRLSEFGTVLPEPESDYIRYVEYDLNVDQKLAIFKTKNIKANSKYLLRTTEESDLEGVPRLQKCRYFGKVQYELGTLGDDDDLEETYFKVLTEQACDWANGRGWIPNDWEGEDLGSMCKHLHAHLIWLEANPEAGRPGDLNQFDIDDELE